MPTAAGSGPSRRAILAAVPLVGAGASVLLASAGCTGSDPVAPTPTANPADVAAAAAAHQREAELLTAYDAAISRHPGLATTLRTIRAHHADHASDLAALGLPGVGAPTTSAAAATAPTTSTGDPVPNTAAPADTSETQAATLTTLAALEGTTAAAHRAGCLTASTGLAGLLASLCAAESAHAELIGKAQPTVAR
ncbi:hypothetical protein ACG83_05465 [Frankia sp. R43]|uniref:hypothetical protein n=1 Tax=Frankia sp. R43 TaxID=269536 RepID=UPI0006C9F8F9|nr:hypothetical protein [Frankia sp. R43]KPM57202.1 hypothetical protein ACG83_05465 [Frankia sp. R43]